MVLSGQKAEVADIQRALQRDSAFVGDIQEDFAALLKLLGNNTYKTYRKYLPVCANAWYYFTTSLSNRQTLGEEYAGIIRIVSGIQLPGKTLQLIWLMLFLCGEDLSVTFLNTLKKSVTQSTALKNEAKQYLINTINFLIRNKSNFKALHRSIFYITGTYYSLANRLTGIKYLLLRSWLQDATYSQSFKLLGKVSLAYLVYTLAQDFVQTESDEIAVYKDCEPVSSKMCVLCGDIRQNTSATPCGHLFCWDCIHNCLLYQSNCPICRDFIKPNKIVLLQNYF